MTLEEAIRHAEEKAKCGGRCGEDHAQLAEWLKELRERRTAESEKRTEERTETHACDSISRQAAIDAFSNNGSFFVYGADVCKAIVSRIKQLPAAEPEPHWIPCSESLPEEAYPVIVTWKNDDPASYYQYILGKHYVGVAHYKNGKWFWYSSVTEDTLMEYGRCDSEEFDEAIECIAWMPLPEPYGGEQDG